METCEQILQRKWPGKKYTLGPGDTLRNVLFRSVVVEDVGTEFVRDEQAERNAALGEAFRSWLDMYGLTSVYFRRWLADSSTRLTIQAEEALFKVVAPTLEAEEEQK